MSTTGRTREFLLLSLSLSPYASWVPRIVTHHPLSSLQPLFPLTPLPTPPYPSITPNPAIKSKATQPNPPPTIPTAKQKNMKNNTNTQKNSDYEEWTSSPSALTHFFTTCLTASSPSLSSRCALSSQNKSASTVESDLQTFLHSLRSSPIPAPKSNTLIDTYILKSYILSQLKSTFLWPLFSLRLSNILYGSPEERVSTLEAIITEAVESQEFGIPSFEIMSSFLGIHCSDRIVRLDSFEEQEREGVFEGLYEASWLVGDVVAWISAQCAHWPWRSGEVFDFGGVGDGNGTESGRGVMKKIKTRRPILVASNVLDSHTPLVSARNVSGMFEGSGLLVVDGVGVCGAFFFLFAFPCLCSLIFFARFLSLVLHFSCPIFPSCFLSYSIFFSRSVFACSSSPSCHSPPRFLIPYSIFVFFVFLRLVLSLSNLSPRFLCCLF